MKTFEEWFDSYAGINRLTNRDTAKECWNYQQDKIDKLKKENEWLKSQLNITEGGKLKGDWANLEKK